MKKIIFLTCLVLLGCMSSFVFAQTHEGIVSYAHKEGKSNTIYYKKELSTVNGEYISKYKLYDQHGVCYSIIKVIHNRQTKTIYIKAQPPSINIFKDGVYEYEFEYTDDLGLGITYPDKLNQLFGGNKNLLTVRFYSPKREHLKLIEIITGGTDIDTKYHYYLDM
jgi:hypothetical protein